MTGPASTALEQELLGELRRQGIVVWLDKDATYTRFVDDLTAKQAAGEFPFPVVGFRGSFLDLLFKLEDFGSGLDKQPLLVHMPGFNEETIRKTPILELYEPGVRFRKGLDSLIREAATAKVAPAEVEKFVAKQPSLEDADAWLTSAAAESSFGLGAALAEFGPKMLADALARPASLEARVTGPEEVDTLGKYIHTLTGMDTEWERFYADKDAKPLARTLHQLGAWVLAVEYVHDLRRPPHDANLQRLTSLSAPLVKACCELAAQLRRDDGDAYTRLADEVEGFLHAELEAMSAEDLGQVDTFRAEEDRVLTGAVNALAAGDWAKAKAWCDARQGEKSFWLQRDPLRRWAWNLVDEAAKFGETLGRHTRPFAGTRSLDEATQQYAEGPFEVDRAHRRFEQARLALLESRLPHYGKLREAATDLRRRHRAWADALCKDFTGLCREQGFLPSSELRQRNLFEQVVHPLMQESERVAVFMIDAFRYEMATELVENLEGPGTTVNLKPRLAELPTITAVGMNVLAPVANNERLTLSGVFTGFKTAGSTVRRPEDRAKAMGMRSAGKPALLLTLAAVCEADTEDLRKKVKPHRLIVVHSKEIDDAGEANVGLPTFESTLRQIKAAWHHLQLAGVTACVFTADHGFLLQDETTTLSVPFGSKLDPQRRHVLDDYARQEVGMVPVSLSSLGYDGLDKYLLLREDTAVFATGAAGASFVHGGNSPQERVIPVLTVTRKRREPGGYSEYAVEVSAAPPTQAAAPSAQEPPKIPGLHYIRLRLVHPPGTLGFVSTKSVELSLRARDHEAVRVVIKDVAGPATQRTGRLSVTVGEAWTEVWFGLEGPIDERVRVEVYHADNVEKVRAAAPEHWYSVSGTQVSAATKGPKAPSAPPPAAPAPPAAEGWAATIADEGARKVFLHIEKHGVVTEPEVTKLLGSPRAFRRFSLEFETHLPKLPFRVRIDVAEGGKRYKRDGDL